LIDYELFKEDNLYKARNLVNGVIEFTDVDAVSLINLVTSDNPGMTCHLLEGTFILTSSILPNALNVTIQGLGDATVLERDPSAGDFILIETELGCTLKDFVLDGNWFVRTEVWINYGILMRDNISGLVLENLEIKNVECNAVTMGEHASDISVTGCVFHNNLRNGISGRGGNNNVLIDNCTFYNNWDASIHISIDFVSTDWHISNCTFTNEGYRVKLRNTNNIVVEDCVWTDCGRTPGTERTNGSLGFERCKNAQCNNCVMTGSYGYSFSTRGSDGLVVNNLQAHDCHTGAHIGMLQDEFLDIQSKNIQFIGGHIGGINNEGGYIHHETCYMGNNSENITFDGVTFTKSGPDGENCFYINNKPTGWVMKNCVFNDFDGSAIISYPWDEGGSFDDFTFDNNRFNNCGKGIDVNDGDNVKILNNIFTNCNIPIDINNVDVVNPVVNNNNWEGCANNILWEKATTPSFYHNTDKDGNIWPEMQLQNDTTVGIIVAIAIICALGYTIFKK